MAPEADLATRLVAALRRRGETVATCESLTAGLVAAEIATVPGASAVLRGGLVTYATELKTTVAGVDPRVIGRFGVVSRETAQAMAAGARSVCGAAWGVATTGVAGPEAVDGLPPGTVCVAVSGAGRVVSEQVALVGDRASIRRGSVTAVLEILLAEVGRGRTVGAPASPGG